MGGSDPTKWCRGLSEHDTFRELEGVQDNISPGKGKHGQAVESK